MLPAIDIRRVQSATSAVMRTKVILRAPTRLGATQTLARVFFWLLLFGALIVEGRTAAQGLPVVLDSVLPDGLIAAEAKDEDPPQSAFVTLHSAAHASLFAPEVLSPVVSHAFPRWLVASPRDGAPAELRGAEAGGDSASEGAPAAAAPDAAASARPAIAIVIDDLGAEVSATRRAIRLPRAITLSFLPYADTTPSLAREGAEAGHQILVHVPMEPEGPANPGPNALLTQLTPAQIVARLDWDLARVPDFSGVNNHMGSRFTADAAALVPVVETLADRHVFFLDSRTTPNSAVVPLAHQFGVPSAGRDVFLDDDQSGGAIDRQLFLLERVARDSGIAIAIGHPHAATLDALESWLAHAQGFRLVDAGTAIRLKAEHEAVASLHD